MEVQKGYMMEIFYVLIPIQYDVTRALDIKNRLEMICDSTELNPYSGATAIFRCVGDYQKVRDSIGGKEEHIVIVSTSERKRYKCLVAGG